MAPTKSAMYQDCRPMVGSGAELGWWTRLRLGGAHASTGRPAPSTLGVVGERGSRRESCLQLVPAAGLVVRGGA
jgi:hypothetical protein